MVINARYPGRCYKCGQPIKVGDQINWEKGAGATHVACPATRTVVEGRVTAHGTVKAVEVTRPVEPAGTITWSEGEGEGGAPVSSGTVLRHEGRIITITGCRSRYYREDGMSFGVGDEQGYVYTYTARLATEAEAAPVLEREAQAARRRAAVKRLAEIKKSIRESGEYPEGDHTLEGERLIDTQNIYGGGDWFVLTAEHIWYVENNGADGDDWGHNNVRTGGAGAIGRRVAYDEALASELRGLAQVLKEMKE